MTKPKLKEHLYDSFCMMLIRVVWKYTSELASSVEMSSIRRDVEKMVSKYIDRGE